MQRQILSPKIVLSAVLLTCLLALSIMSWQPHWRGGYFVSVIVTGTTLMLAVTLWHDIRAVRVALNNTPSVSGSNRSLVVNNSDSLDWEHVLRVLANTVSYCLLFLFLGVYVGGSIFVYAYLCFMRGDDRRLALTLALCLGVFVPWLFASALGLKVWTGLIPTVIPGWLGGDFLPPF